MPLRIPPVNHMLPPADDPTTMNVRLAACDSCRRSKLACGHERPVCVRCRSRGQADSCVYRAQPFKRRKTGESGRHQLTPPPPVDRTQDSSREASSPVSSPLPHRYPNPGFLGPSSHSSIFSQLPPTAGASPLSLDHHAAADAIKDQEAVNKSAKALRQLCQLDMPSLKALVDVWLGEGVNLPLAAPLVSTCADAVYKLWGETSPSMRQSNDAIAERATCLLKNTQSSLAVYGDMGVADFFAQILGDRLRWEVVGIFITAASRAALDTKLFAPLYAKRDQRRRVISTLTSLGDTCLKICLAADCLNDLQLVLQYENFIVHSQVEGDQNYGSWRKMGDLSSSLFALGYHEKLNEVNSQIPGFILELRKATFARIYAADKSLAIFLGRPPRVLKLYCDFQLPSFGPDLWVEEEFSGDSSRQHSPGNHAHQDAAGRELINYMADTRCSASFSYLMEDILQLARNPSAEDRAEKKRALRMLIDEQWEILPSHFQLKTNLRDCPGSGFERDFLVGTRLDYLHTLFLLHLVSSQRTAEPEESLLLVAAEMLSLVVELIILRDQLVNSGSSLIWKVAQYGLPAAGIISMALLSPTTDNSVGPSSRSKMVQDLSVLVAEIRTGAVIQDGEPNFALFTRATQTIQSLLDSLMVWRSTATVVDSQISWGAGQPDDWGLCSDLDPWEFEMRFWANLAEHPTLLNQEN